MYMVLPDWQQASTDNIAETTARIEDITRDFPAIHALSWVWYSGSNLQHWGTESNQSGKEGQILIP